MARIKVEIFDSRSHSFGPTMVKCISAASPVDALVEHCKVPEEIIEEVSNGLFTAETPKADFYAQVVVSPA